MTDQPTPRAPEPSAPDDLREQIAAVCLEHLRPPKYSGGSWTLNPAECAAAVMDVLRREGLVTK